MQDVVELFQDRLQIFSRREGPYGVRFIAAPYTDDEANSIKVLGHNRDPGRLSAQSVEAILAKFQLSDEEFKAAYNEHFSGRYTRDDAAR